MDFKAYTVGDRVTQPSGDQTVFDLTDSGAVLLIKFKEPTEREQTTITSGKAEFKLAVVDDIIFFLCKFGDMAWMDAPYYSKLSKYHIEMPTAPMGLALHVMLIDAATGTLAGQRMIGLDTDFSVSLLVAAVNQPHITNYDQKLADVFKRYKTTDLLKQSR